MMEKISDSDISIIINNFRKSTFFLLGMMTDKQKKFFLISLEKIFVELKNEVQK